MQLVLGFGTWHLVVKLFILGKVHFKWKLLLRVVVC
jgi:hypothetical protein